MKSHLYSRSLIAILTVLALSGIGIQPAHAAVGDVSTNQDPAPISTCFGRSYAYADARIEANPGTGVWQASDYDSSFTLDDAGCLYDNFVPSKVAPAGASAAAFRVYVPRVRYKGKLLPARSKFLGNFKVWNNEPNLGTTPVPHLNAFASKYGDSVATILCSNPNTGLGGQGTGFAVAVSLHPNAVAMNAGSTYLVTAGHVVEDCNYTNYNQVTVIYKGQSYPGRAYGSWSDPDIGTVLTTAPVPPATLAAGAARRPVVGDIGASIGVAGGVIGTTTQGQIVGVSDRLLNTTIPSGHGASGGPVFNNRGEVIGIIVAGNGSLTEATALPVFCGTVYVSPCPYSW